ncbi:hypothetical protein CBP51_16885 [Cellvibrio mixtus]|uniref:Uncharacterized protein n=1 Tax=Cellvibrio mixtus TaxID=39650 RepID=A0A266Q5D7_9GAMM|nr:hypothetical protein CBP51_16885 [Cellvibrio mixtus]
MTGVKIRSTLARAKMTALIAEGKAMIEKIYAKRGGYLERRFFWAWHQRHTPELVHATMLEF